MRRASKMQTFPAWPPSGLTPSSPFSLHISDDELFNDTVLANTSGDDALSSEVSYANAICPISPLWTIDADEIAKEMQDFSFY